LIEANTEQSCCQRCLWYTNVWCIWIWKIL